MLEEIIQAINLNPAYPLPCVYGFNDTLTRPYASVNNFVKKPEYDTGGVTFNTYSYEVWIYSDSLPQLEQIENAVSSYLIGLQLTTLTMFGSNMLQESSYINPPEQLYVYCVKQSYTVYENIS